jgi:hypothetical protein
MADSLEDGTPAQSGVAAETVPDRRRPGRLKDVSPDLIPLLRDPIAIEIPSDDALAPEHPRDELGAAKGIVVSLLLAAPFWFLIALGIWWAFR